MRRFFQIGYSLIVTEKGSVSLMRSFIFNYKFLNDNCLKIFIWVYSETKAGLVLENWWTHMLYQVCIFDTFTKFNRLFVCPGLQIVKSARISTYQAKSAPVMSIGDLFIFQS